MPLRPCHFACAAVSEISAAGISLLLHYLLQGFCGFGMALLSRKRKPLYGFFVALLHAFAAKVAQAKVILGFVQTLLGSKRIPFYCFFVVLCYA